MNKIATCLLAGGLFFGGYETAIAQQPDLRVVKEGVKIRITNIGENPVEVREVIFNDGRCKPPPREVCADIAGKIKKIKGGAGGGDPSYGGFDLTIDTIVCMHGYPKLFPRILVETWTPIKKPEYPVTLHEGQSIQDIPPDSTEASCKDIEVIRITVVTDKGNAAFTWR
jgi:hypothetical protein